MPSCICTKCGEIGDFRAKRGMRLADQPCRCGGVRTTRTNFRVVFRVTREPNWLRYALCFTVDDARKVADGYRTSTMFGGYTVVAIEQRETRPSRWVALA